MSDYRFAAILLAAGRSARFEGDNKLVEDFRGRPLLFHALDLIMALPLAQRVLVTGSDAADIASLAMNPRIDTVYNPSFADGVATSIVRGIASLRADVDAALIVLGDMPRVRAADVERLLAAFDPSGGRTILVPAYHGRRGNPVLFGRDHFPALAELEGDRGARSVVDGAGSSVAEAPVEDDGILFDCDTRADFASA